MRKLIVFFGLLLFSTFLSAQQYDLVLEGGRVIDPESGLDAIRNVGITNGKVA
jgi:N-acyl-D-glutamate deacylase